MRYNLIWCQEVFLKINRAVSYLYEIITVLNENTNRYKFNSYSST